MNTAPLAALLAKVAPKALMCGDSRSFVRHAGVDGHLGLFRLAGLKSVAWSPSCRLAGVWAWSKEARPKRSDRRQMVLSVTHSWGPEIRDLVQSTTPGPHPISIAISLPFPISFACKCARVLAQHKAIVFPVCKKYAKLKFMRN